MRLCTLHLVKMVDHRNINFNWILSSLQWFSIRVVSVWCDMVTDLFTCKHIVCIVKCILHV